MNVDQALSFIRSLLIFFGGLAASKGWLSSGDVSALTAALLSALGPVVSLGSLVWGLYAHSEASKVASAAAVPGVRKIVADTELAAVVDSIKVVPPSFKPGG